MSHLDPKEALGILILISKAVREVLAWRERAKGNDRSDTTNLKHAAEDGQEAKR